MQGIHKKYGEGESEVKALKGITIDVLSGDFLVLITISDDLGRSSFMLESSTLIIRWTNHIYQLILHNDM